MNKLISGGAWPDDDISGAWPSESIRSIDAVQLVKPVNLTVIVVVRLAVGQALNSRQSSSTSDSWRGGWGWYEGGGGC